MPSLTTLLLGTTPSASLDAAIEVFLFRCDAEGLSPATHRFYRQQLDTLRRFLTEHNLPTAPDAWTPDHLRAYLLHLRQEKRTPSGKPLSPFSIAAAYRAVSAFARWLHREGYTSHNAAQGLAAPRTPKPHIPGLSGPEIERLLAAPNARTDARYRDRVAITVLVDTGLRLSELLGITLADLNLREGTVRVWGKGRKQRVVGIGLRSRRALAHYLTIRGNPAGQPLLFLTQSGEALKPRHLQQRIAAYGKKAGLGRVHPHLLRRTFARHWLVNGGGIVHLKAALGHTTLAQSEYYASLLDADLLTAARSASPMDRL